MTNPSRFQPFHTVTKGYSLFSVAEIFANEKAVHRVPVVDSNRQLINIITQSQFLRFIHDHMKELGTVKDTPISELITTHNPVMTISEDQPAIRAFSTMISQNISGMGVVDSTGKLVENISLRDLKAIQSDGRMFWRLNQTVKHFLEKIRKEFGKKDDRPGHVMYVTDKDTLETVINLCFYWEIHRVHVVDANKKPISVISLKDIIHEILTSV